MKKNTRKYHAFPRNLPSCWKNKTHTFENNINILPILTNLSISVVAQSCLTLCDPMNCRPPGSSVHGILQARILKWLAISFSRGFSQPRDWTWVFPITGRCFTLWATRETLTNLDSILKSRDITLPAKVCQVKTMVFPVVMYGCEHWTVKKAERRIDAFDLRCWRRLLRIPWTARRSNQSILKISPGISLEGKMLKLKLQYFGHLMWRGDSLEDSVAGRNWGQKKGTTEDEMAGWHHWLDGRESEWTPGVGYGLGGLACCDSWGRK